MPPGLAAPRFPLQTMQSSLSSIPDFKPFASRAVAPEVTNAAMKETLRDPHFQRDGRPGHLHRRLHPSPTPLPAAMLRQKCAFMGLVEETGKAIRCRAGSRPAGWNDKDPNP